MVTGRIYHRPIDFHYKFQTFTFIFGLLFRVATTQGIWLLTFPDRENTGNLVNLIFYTGKIVATQGNFSKFRIF